MKLIRFRVSTVVSYNWSVSPGKPTMMSVDKAMLGNFLPDGCDSLFKLLKCIFAAHLFQDLVTSSLDRDMEMVDYHLVATHQLDDFVSDLAGLDRRDPQPLQTRNLNQVPKKISKIIVGKILAIASGVDSRQDNFAKPFGHQFLGLFKDAGLVARTHLAPAVGNDAIRAEVVAAILDFQIRPGVFETVGLTVPRIH